MLLCDHDRPKVEEHDDGLTISCLTCSASVTIPRRCRCGAETMGDTAPALSCPACQHEFQPGAAALPPLLTRVLRRWRRIWRDNTELEPWQPPESDPLPPVPKSPTFAEGQEQTRLLTPPPGEKLQAWLDREHD